MQSATTGHEIHDIAIVGGGASGLATASSLLAMRRDLDIVMVEPQTKHYYQPSWTMVGAGVFRAASTERDKAELLPRRARRLKGAAAGLSPETNEVILDNGSRSAYRGPRHLARLGRHPRPSRDAWQKRSYLKLSLRSCTIYVEARTRIPRRAGALYATPMPIKCAGAPQKALYLSCDH
jgi:sulfide:quinone oxidoreductase